MLKKLRKTLSKEIKSRYEKMESRYLGLENRIYTTIEDRLTLLESKFDDLSDLIKEEVRNRKERNEDKIEEIELEDDGMEFSERVEEVKEIVGETIKDTKKKVNVKVKEAKEVVNEKVEEAKKVVASKLKKGKKAKEKAEKKAKEVVNEKVKEAKDATNKKGKDLKKQATRLKEAFADQDVHQAEEDKVTHDYSVALDDVAQKAKKAKKDKKESKSTSKGKDNLTVLVGLGEKMAEKLKAEGITTFQQLAKMTQKDINALDDKIKSFAARFKRYEWGNQAKQQQ